MTPDDQLDTVLRHLDNDLPDRETFTDIMKNIGFDISDKNIELLVNKLVNDGHVQASPLTSGGHPNGKYSYNITFQGRQFLNHSFIYKNRPYKAKATLAKINKVWTIIKTTVVVINAVIILSIAAIGVWVSYDSKQKDADIRVLTSQLDKQAATIDSLAHALTATKTDTTQKQIKPKP